MTQSEITRDYYAFQFMDGSWRIAPLVQHQWSGRPDLPRSILDGVYATRAAAVSALVSYAKERAA